ncbi:hypothetical protein [Lyngbya sp. CCY1209]|uniref:hypothetical protein n=1 Tax=Lyngbya sp. CCY1209 TaxID=2886103 RepID=UPI002D20D661|nr:hypothetical protein [Lyngbya sp. CCY1209]MEB3887337.1 hypothetical protein [Lyngbya sp. CCY1209]
MSKKPNEPQLGTTVILYIFGIALVITAIIITLKGLGILDVIPRYIIWALILLSVGLGILSAIGNKTD